MHRGGSVAIIGVKSSRLRSTGKPTHPARRSHQSTFPFPCASPKSVTIPLRGATHDHGWPGGTDPNVQYNTLVEVVSDEGLVGLGSCYTTRAAGRGGAGTACSRCSIGETGARARARQPRSCGRSMFWQGRGGSVEHAISGIDIALWDLLGKALGQPVSRLLGGNYRDRIKPYGSMLFDDPPLLAEKLHEQVAPRLPRDQDGLAAVWPRQPQVRRAAGARRRAKRSATTWS